MKIAVGTVQFGLPYGIANRVGQTPRDMAAAILARAKKAGARFLDTAIAYGDAETVLGEIGAAQDGWQIISKLPALPAHLPPGDVEGWCRTTITASLMRLRTDRLSGLLLHHPGDLRGPNGSALARSLLDLRNDGLILATGLSIYGPEDLDALLPEGPANAPIPLDIVQSPANPLDRRLEQSGWANRLAQTGTRIHLRSAFLQGLLLMPPADTPNHLSHATPDLRRWHDWLAREGVDPLTAALRFALSRTYAECVVLGMDSPDHLEQILAANQADCPIPPTDLQSANAILLDPRKWTAP